MAAAPFVDNDTPPIGRRSGLVKTFRAIPIITLDLNLLCIASSLQRRVSHHWYGCRIAAAAITGGCGVLHSKDMQHGRVVDGARIETRSANWRHAPVAPISCGMTLQLGHHAPLPASPAEAVLDYVRNPRPGRSYLVRFTAPEFTSLCPVTGQPDFAHIVIDYLPGETIVESKSLKLYLGSFRNHAAFHEDCTVGIGERLVAEMAPRWLRIGGYWYPRGGMPIDVFWQTGAAPVDLWLPDQGVSTYRGRG